MAELETARASTQTDPLPSSSRASLAPSQASRRRATLDVSGASGAGWADTAQRSNRLSGFFSQLLPRKPMVREASGSPPASPAPRSLTPPPALSAPTLGELGLSLCEVTGALSAAQYAMAPTSGTFLAPHYLLLCHGQGLDVVPLSGPPVPQPYALVRRVGFKSVLVMEERGVLVAIAGRRDGVRVYALEEVRRAVEWRLELELRREADQRRSDKGKRPAPPPSYAASVGPPRPLITRVSTANLAAPRAASKADPSDDEALVAAGPEASAALDERTSLHIAGTHGTALSSMRSALATLRPRPATTAPPPDEATADAVSFADMLRESRLPPPSVPPDTTQRRASVVMLSHPVFQPPDDPRPRRWSLVAPSSTSLPEPTLAVPPPPSPRQGSHRSTRSHPLPSTPPATPVAPPRRRLFPKILGAFAAKKARSRSTDRAPPPPTDPEPTAAPKLEYIKLPGTKGAIMIKAVETPKKSFLAILCGDSGEKVELFAGTYRTALGLSRTFILPDSPKSLELQLQGDDLVEVFLVFAQNVFGLEPATVRVREVRIGRNERRAARRRARAGAETVVTTTVSTGDDPGPSRRSASLARRRRQVQGRVVTSPEDVPPLPSPSGTSTPLAVPSQPTDPVADELAALSTVQAGPYTTFQQLLFAPQFPLAAIADDYIIPPTYLQFLDYRDKWEPHLPRVEAAPPVQPEDPEQSRRKDKAREDLQDALDLDDDRDDDREDDRSDSGLDPPEPVQPPQPTVVKWFYLDPKGVVQGPWKPSIMQNWLREGYLPPELPVRRADETEYTLLKDLRASVEDPAEPFKSANASPVPAEPAAPDSAGSSSTIAAEAVTLDATAPDATAPEAATPEAPPAPDASSSDLPAESTEPAPPFAPTKALLKPTSLLAQPRHFGPPALFYCSRGGHSTTVVDARGRPVLKSRIHWSTQDYMGDTHRVEAFDVGDRAVFVALRQGGIEATDVGEALLEPGDESRTALPGYRVHPGAAARRGPWVWRTGTAISSGGVGLGKQRVAPVKRRTGAPGIAIGGTAREEVDKVGEGEYEGEVYVHADEGIIFLARQGDAVYICERSGGKFRLLKLSKIQA